MVCGIFHDSSLSFDKNIEIERAFDKAWRKIEADYQNLKVVNANYYLNKNNLSANLNDLLQNNFFDFDFWRTVLKLAIMSSGDTEGRKRLLLDLDRPYLISRKIIDDIINHIAKVNPKCLIGTKFLRKRLPEFKNEELYHCEHHYNILESCLKYENLVLCMQILMYLHHFCRKLTALSVNRKSH